MDMVSTLKWGQPKSDTFGLVEGLATLFSPETLDCDGHTFEERYVYFLQSGKLLATDSTENVNFIRDVDSMAQIETDSLQVDSQVSENNATHEILDKIYWSQTAYIVGYLLDNYGIEKYRQLWQIGVSHFNLLGFNSPPLAARSKIILLRYPDRLRRGDSFFYGQLLSDLAGVKENIDHNYD